MGVVPAVGDSGDGAARKRERACVYVWMFFGGDLGLLLKRLLR